MRLARAFARDAAGCFRSVLRLFVLLVLAGAMSACASGHGGRQGGPAPDLAATVTTTMEVDDPAAEIASETEKDAEAEISEQPVPPVLVSLSDFVSPAKGPTDGWPSAAPKNDGARIAELSKTAPAEARIASIRIPPLRPRQRPELEREEPRPLVIEAIVGAPGDGNQALATAMREHLEALGAPMAANRAGREYVLDALVASVRKGDRDELTIIWRVWTEDEMLGEVVQRNAVPAGALDGAWGQTAYAAAGDARNGVLHLIARHSAGAQLARAKRGEEEGDAG